MSDLRLAPIPESEFVGASLLPANRTRVEEALEKAVRASDPDVTPVATLMNPKTCPAHLLSWLAWAFSVDFWDDGWSEENKRAVIAASVSVHRRKGTLAAVKEALASAGFGDAKVRERHGWETYNGAANFDGSIYYDKPDHWAEYRLELARPISIKQADQVRAILANVAPARAVLKALEFTEALNLYDAHISYDGQYTHGVA